MEVYEIGGAKCKRRVGKAFSLPRLLSDAGEQRLDFALLILRGIAQKGRFQLHSGTGLVSLCEQCIGEMQAIGGVLGNFLDHRSKSLQGAVVEMLLPINEADRVGEVWIALRLRALQTLARQVQRFLVISVKIGDQVGDIIQNGGLIRAQRQALPENIQRLLLLAVRPVGVVAAGVTAAAGVSSVFAAYRSFNV